MQTAEGQVQFLLDLLMHHSKAEWSTQHNDILLDVVATQLHSVVRVIRDIDLQIHTPLSLLISLTLTTMQSP